MPDKSKVDLKRKFSKRLVCFTVNVIQLARKHESDRLLSPIFNQVIRSAGSVGANVHEAHGALSKTGYARYFRIALQSAHETAYWFSVLSEAGLRSEEAIQKLNNELVELTKILGASLRTMSRRE